jgi:hypothetical protein
MDNEEDFWKLITNNNNAKTQQDSKSKDNLYDEIHTLLITDEFDKVAQMEQENWKDDHFLSELVGISDCSDNDIFNSFTKEFHLKRISFGLDQQFETFDKDVNKYLILFKKIDDLIDKKEFAKIKDLEEKNWKQKKGLKTIYGINECEWIRDWIIGKFRLQVSELKGKWNKKRNISIYDHVSKLLKSRNFKQLRLLEQKCWKHDFSLSCLLNFPSNEVLQNIYISKFFNCIETKRDLDILEQELKSMSSENIDILHAKLADVNHKIEVKSFLVGGDEDDWKDDFCLSRLYGLDFNHSPIIPIKSFQKRFKLFNKLLTKLDKKNSRSHLYKTNLFLIHLSILKDGDIKKIRDSQRTWWENDPQFSSLHRYVKSSNEIIQKLFISRFLSDTKYFISVNDINPVKKTKIEQLIIILKNKIK